MKRLILFIVAFVYLLFAIGINFHMHYCMGQLASWSLIADNSEACNKCGMDKELTQSSGCCKDEYKQVKIKVDQKTFPTGPTLYAPVFTELLLQYFAPLTDFSSPPIDYTFQDHAPHLCKGIAVYVRNCNFRI